MFLKGPQDLGCREPRSGKPSDVDHLYPNNRTLESGVGGPAERLHGRETSEVCVVGELARVKGRQVGT